MNEWKREVRSARHKYIKEWGERLALKKDYEKQEYINNKLIRRQKQAKRTEEKRETERKEFLKQQAIAKLRAKETRQANNRREGLQSNIRHRREFQMRYLREERNKWIMKEEDINDSIFDNELELVGFWHEDRVPSMPQSFNPDKIPLEEEEKTNGV